MASRPLAAQKALAEALRLAPADKRPQLETLQKEIAAAARPDDPATPQPLSGPARRQHDALLLIIEEADQARQDPERKRLLREFFEQSEAFLREPPLPSPRPGDPGFPGPCSA